MPNGYIEILEDCKKNPFIVTKMKSDDFLGFQTLKNRLETETGEKLTGYIFNRLNYKGMNRLQSLLKNITSQIHTRR